METSIDYKLLYDLCSRHSDNLFLVLTPDFLIKDINVRAEKILGWKRKDILGQPITSIFQKTQTQPFIHTDRPLKKTKVITYIDIHKKNIKIVWDVMPIQASNAPCQFIVIIGKKGTQLANQQLEDLQLENIVRYAPGLFYWKDKNSVYQGCNDEFVRLAGLESREEVKGKTDFDLIWKDRAELYVEVDKKVIKSGKAILNHIEVVASKDKDITAITNKVPYWQ